MLVIINFSAINMPIQSVNTTKGVAVTHRKLNLSDLLGQLKHYSENTRKGADKIKSSLMPLDALLGLKELFTLHPNELTLHLSQVFEQVVEKMLDPSSNVRKALHTLLTYLFSVLHVVHKLSFTLSPLTWYQDYVSPYLPVFIVYITSAMSHADFNISIDSIPVLGAWLKSYPHVIATKHKQVDISLSFNFESNFRSSCFLNI